MIKAKKGLIITLFAAMMVFAFGASSAFALGDTGFTWEDNYQTVTYSDSTYSVDVDYVFSDGVIVATAEASKTGAATVTETKYFYDFNNAALKVAQKYSLGDYVGLNETNATVTLKAPAYASNTGQKQLTSNFGPWSVTYVTDQYAVPGPAKIGADVVLKAVGGNHDGSSLVTADVVGALAEQDVTILDDPATDATHWYEVVDGKAVTRGDEVDFDSTVTLTRSYDGAEHTLYAPYAAKATISYQVWNGTKYEAVESVKYKDAAAQKTYRAVYQIAQDNGSVIVKYVGLNLTVSKITSAPGYAWAAGNAKKSDAGVSYYYEVTAAQAADPAAFVEFDNRLAEAQADVNIDEIKAFFNDRYDIVVTKNEIDPNLQTWTIDPKTLTNAELTALAKKYEVLEGNYTFGTYPNQLLSVYDLNGRRGPGANKNEITVKVSGTLDNKVDDINFVNAPNATYKVKKAKKLKKTKSFTVEAKAESGNAVKYAISSPSNKITIDATTGKVTVKKGLKKGTYKVKVKAKTEAGNGYQACKEETTITIKIKK